MASFFKKLVQTGAKVAEVAAPIVGAAVGGPAGAKVGAAVGGGIKNVASVKALGGSGGGQPGVAIPSSASSLGEARSQDRNRMKTKYGVPLGGLGGTDV